MSKFTFTEAPPGEQKTQPREEPALLPAPGGQGLGVQIVRLDPVPQKELGDSSRLGRGAGVFVHTHPVMFSEFSACEVPLSCALHTGSMAQVSP